MSEETLNKISNIISKRANLINISLPLREFVLLSEILRDKNCKVFSLGVQENDENESNTKVLLGGDCLKTMEQYQLKRSIDLIHVKPAVENSIKRLKETLAMEPKKCRDLSFLLNEETSYQTKSIINKLVKMEQITDEVLPARIATLDRENEKEGTKLRNLVNNGLSSNIKKS